MAVFCIRRKCQFIQRLSILILILAVLIITVFHFDSHLDRRETASHITRVTSDINVPKVASSKGPAKVVELAYMRGGSSLFGQLFYQNPEAFYWYEGLAGVYSHLYGVMTELVPLQFSHYRNGTPRNFPRYEEEAIIQNINNMLSCNLQSLPVDVLVHPFMSKTTRVHNYTRCMAAKARNISGVQKPGQSVNITSYTRCQKLLTSVCAFKPDLPITCYDSLRSEPRWDSDGPFAKHKDCISKLESKLNPCLKHLQTACTRSKLRTIKALRWGMKIADKILKSDADIKIIHYVRDPRGTVRSRVTSGLMSPHAKRRVVKEAELLCGKMLENLKMFRLLQIEYPGRILQLRYEDLVMQPELTITRVYEFIRIPQHHQVNKWLKASMNATRHSGSFSYKRKNGTATAFAWRDTLGEKVIDRCTHVCREVLLKLDYPINV